MVFFFLSFLLFVPGNDCITAKYDKSTETFSWTSVEKSTKCSNLTRTGEDYNLICIKKGQCFHYVVYYQEG